VGRGPPRSTAVLTLMVILLTAALAFLYTAYSDLQERYRELKHNYEALVPEADVIIINDRDYYSVAKELIEAANESVYVIMYVLKYDPGDPDDPANALVWALGNASARGVEVAVIIEGETAETSEAAYNYFMKVGVNATWDREGVRTHCKLMIVDRYLVLVGSHNWTESALSYNHETSVLIRSEKAAEAEIRYFNQIWAEATATGG